MKSKWFIDRTNLHRFPGKFWILPCISLWYDKDYFYETGVHTPALGIEVFWFNLGWGMVIQKGY